jgi:hypothetical protein
MPKIDFNKIDDVGGFTPLPDGKYPCRLDDIEESATQYGDEMWKLKFAVTSGEHKGRFIFDNLVFSAKALKRAKLICSRLGVDVSGEVELTPAMLIGKECILTAETEEYENEEGVLKKRNFVPFAGYERLDEGVAAAASPSPSADGAQAESAPADESEEGLPF